MDELSAQPGERNKKFNRKLVSAVRIAALIIAAQICIHLLAWAFLKLVANAPYVGTYFYKSWKITCLLVLLVIFVCSRYSGFRERFRARIAFYCVAVAGLSDPIMRTSVNSKAHVFQAAGPSLYAGIGAFAALLLVFAREPIYIGLFDDPLWLSRLRCKAGLTDRYYVVVKGLQSSVEFGDLLKHRLGFSENEATMLMSAGTATVAAGIDESEARRIADDLTDLGAAASVCTTPTLPR